MRTSLHFDLRADATRARLLETVLAAMSEEGRQGIEEAFSGIVVSRSHHHTLVEIEETIDGLALGFSAKAHLKSVYRILAEAEARVHGRRIEKVHFHEIGTAKALQNAACISLAIDRLAPGKITASCVQAGKGTGECAHGSVDFPAPATAAILAQGIPLCDERLEGELCTPTSAAFIKHYVDEFID